MKKLQRPLKNLTGYWREEIRKIRFRTIYDHRNVPFSRIVPENFKFIGSTATEVFTLEAIIHLDHRTLYIEYFSF